MFSCMASFSAGNTATFSVTSLMLWLIVGLMMFFFLSVSIRCLTKGKLKKRKHGKHIFLKQYAFQTRGSSAVGVSCESKLLVRADVAGRVGVYRVKDRFILLLSASPLHF